MHTLKQQIADYIAQNPLSVTLEMAEHFQQPEGDILCALPEEFVRIFSAERAVEIMTEISKWGTLQLLLKRGYIFEIKDRFPTGMVGRGYYNLNLKDDESTMVI